MILLMSMDGISSEGPLSFLSFFIDMYLIYNIVLVSHSVFCVAKSFSYIFFGLFSIIGYYKILNMDPCAIQ